MTPGADRFLRAAFFAAATALLLGYPAGESVARSRFPSYKTAEKQFAKLWKEKFPVKTVSVTANPAKRGVLRVWHRGAYVYYYEFRVLLPRPVRDESGKIVRKGTRRATVWLRYRRNIKKKPWDLTFARRDLLPGKYRRWYKVR